MEALAGPPLQISGWGWMRPLKPPALPRHIHHLALGFQVAADSPGIPQGLSPFLPRPFPGHPNRCSLGIGAGKQETEQGAVPLRPPATAAADLEPRQVRPASAGEPSQERWCVWPWMPLCPLKQ